MARFGFETAVRGRVAVVTLRGELDLAAAAELEPALEELLEGAYDVVALDLRELDFLDSSGLRLVVIARNRLLDEDRRLVLVRGSQRVQRVFEITRMTERLEFVDVPEAIVV
jgi:anti-sigma B factor antagonist